MNINTFEEREDTLLLRRALTICNSLLETVKNKSRQKSIEEINHILTLLLDNQKRDYTELMEHVLSSLPQEEMGKC